MTTLALPAPKVAGLLAAPVSNSLRVEWCERAWDLLRRRLLPEMPERAAITVGFPFKGAASSKQKRIGECWNGWRDSEGQFISLHLCLFPDGPKVLAVLLHEAVHTTVGTEHGHRGPFVKMARSVGLEGKPTATYAGTGLQARLEGICAELGALPPGMGDLVSKGKADKGRLRKYECDCGQIIRAASDTLEATHLPCGSRFVRVLA